MFVDIYINHNLPPDHPWKTEYVICEFCNYILDRNGASKAKEFNVLGQVREITSTGATYTDTVKLNMCPKEIKYAVENYILLSNLP